MSREYRIMTGNEACTRGAIAAGMTFYAGYPITPATEIAEMASELMPLNGGKFVQMEDELSSMAAVLGASFAGGKAMTATSGPGFSLMQENLGYGVIAEVPCVVVDVQRQGPCQGVATVPAQGDIMQSRWGTHGDHPIITLAPNSVRETYYETIRAFNLAEKYRTPVILLSDATLAHMSEKVEIPDPDELVIENRKKPTCDVEEYHPYADDETGISPMASFGDGYIWYVSGMVHDETGFPVANNPDLTGSLMKRLHRKIEDNIADIQSWEEYLTEDAEVLLVAIGIVSRSAKAAVNTLRADGIKAGLFRPITLWPFPEKRLEELSSGKSVFTCEMNEGQLYGIVKGCTHNAGNLHSVVQNNGLIIRETTIVAEIKEVL